MRRTALFVSVMAALHGEVLAAAAVPAVRASQYVRALPAAATKCRVAKRNCTLYIRCIR